jgi:hypothetical protein
MASDNKTLTTAEFSKKSGIPVSTITQMLRRDKIRGEKRSGKWAIYESELEQPAVVGQKERRKLSASPAPRYKTQADPANAYDVETFAHMTYLTEKGVRQWLKSGRLSGSTDADGKVTVDAANLDRPELQHLIRK